MTTAIDILGLGCTAVDEILYVDAYPSPDTKTPVRRRERQCGGLTATALVAAARLGARCAYAGTLGDDEHSRFVADALAREGVNVRHAVRRADARAVRSVIVVDERRRTRNIFYDLEGVVGADRQQPSASLVRSSKVLFVDRFGVPGMMRAARIARAAGIPVVADLESPGQPGVAALIKLADHLIVSEEFALKFTRSDHPAIAVARLRARRHQAAVVTCGEGGCWFQEHTWVLPRHHPAFRVNAVDTTGCGDVFHGAYAFARARPVARRPHPPGDSRRRPQGDAARRAGGHSAAAGGEAVSESARVPVGGEVRE